MSDETSITPKPREEAALYVHYCEHPDCTTWGSFGFAVGKTEPTWFCFEHRPEWKARPVTIRQ